MFGQKPKSIEGPVMALDLVEPGTGEVAAEHLKIDKKKRDIPEELESKMLYKDVLRIACRPSWNLH